MPNPNKKSQNSGFDDVDQDFYAADDDVLVLGDGVVLTASGGSAHFSGSRIEDPNND